MAEVIILPECCVSHTKLFLPIPAAEWRVSSQAQWKDVFGNENRTRFNVTARHFGHIVWRGWFEDRDDWDAFSWALARGSLQYERELWDLPTPSWRPYVGDGIDLVYEFITTVFIVAGGSYSVPSDCAGITGLSGEFIDAIGSGGSGGSRNGGGQTTGGGGGGWSRVVSLALTPSSSVTIQIGTFGAAAAGTANGATGTDTWFNGASLGASSVGAKGGGGGLSAASGSTLAGGAGGDAASGIGTTKNSGGRGGNLSTFAGSSTGGGGAAGPNGAGNNGVDTATGGVATNGGSGDAGSGGAAGIGSAAAPPVPTAGGNGTEYDATHGSGGGGGGARHTGAGNTTGGASGSYAGGGASASTPTSTATSAAGGPALIVVAYTPVAAGAGGNKAFNMPMMGR